MKKTIYLVRHAQTTMNAKGKVFSGSSDVSLSEAGIESTKKMAENPLWKEMEEIYVTNLKRTHETADILFGKEVKRVEEPRFAEVDFGTYEGSIRTKENENDPVFYKWANDPEHLTFPGGDNMLSHAQDAYRALMEIIKESKAQRIAIVSHATTLRMLVSLIQTGNIKGFRSVPCENGSVIILHVEENGKLEIENRDKA